MIFNSEICKLLNEFIEKLQQKNTMDAAENRKIPYLSMYIQRNYYSFSSSIYRKPTSTGWSFSSFQLCTYQL